MPFEITPANDDICWPAKTPLCTHPEHNPPMHMVYIDGHYVYRCPGCSCRQEFTVTAPRW